MYYVYALPFLFAPALLVDAGEYVEHPMVGRRLQGRVHLRQERAELAAGGATAIGIKAGAKGRGQRLKQGQAQGKPSLSFPFLLAYRPPPDLALGEFVRLLPPLILILLGSVRVSQEHGDGQ